MKCYVKPFKIFETSDKYFLITLLQRHELLKNFDFKVNGIFRVSGNNFSVFRHSFTVASPQNISKMMCMES